MGGCGQGPSRARSEKSQGLVGTSAARPLRTGHGPSFPEFISEGGFLEPPLVCRRYISSPRGTEEDPQPWMY